MIEVEVDDSHFLRRGRRYRFVFRYFMLCLHPRIHSLSFLQIWKHVWSSCSVWLQFLYKIGRRCKEIGMVNFDWQRRRERSLSSQNIQVMYVIHQFWTNKKFWSTNFCFIWVFVSWLHRHAFTWLFYSHQICMHSLLRHTFSATPDSIAHCIWLQWTDWIILFVWNSLCIHCMHNVKNISNQFSNQQ